MSGAAAPSPDPVRDAQSLIDAVTRHQVHLERYERGTLKVLLRDLGEASRDLEARLAAQLAKLSRADIAAAPGPRWESERLQALLDEIRNVAAIITDLLTRAVVEPAPSLAQYEVRWMASAVQATARVTLDFTGLSPQVLRAIVTSRPFMGRHIREEIAEMADDQVTILQRGIRQGLLQGQSLGAIVRAVARQGFERSQRDAIRLVRTSVNHITNAASDMLYEQNRDVVAGVKWVSTLDGRTTPVCRARDGKVFPVGKGPRPPAHPNCRSRTIPVLKSWADLGMPEFDVAAAEDGLRPAVTDLRPVSQIPKAERAAKIRQVSASETYNQWLRRQPTAFVQDVLGPTRAALYLRGGLQLDRFVDFSGRSYTLAELRRKHPAEFERLGL